MTVDSRIRLLAADIASVVKGKRDKDPTPFALFFGSSNATAGTWPEKFASRMGWLTTQYKIFSIGGGAFTGVGAGNFDGQLNTAIADTSYAKSAVTHIFLGDMSNDIRALSNITTTATAWFTKAKANYPNAQIIVLPVVWGNSANNNTSNSLNSLGVRVQELRNVIKALEYDVRVVDGSWRWLADDPNWMNADGSVHPNATGYTRIANFMVDAMRGCDVTYDVGSKFIAPLGSINAGASYWTSARGGDFGNISGNITIDSNQPVDANLGQLPYGTRPKAGFFLPVVNASRQVAGTLLISETGLIRTFSTLPAGTYNFNTTYKCF